MTAYRWIAQLPIDRPIDEVLISDVHRRLVTGCDDDHCPPGRLRERDQNVTFGTPRHRGAEGGDGCRRALSGLVLAVRTVFREHDPLVQALALHYHLAAIHPYLDGNGRTARALEALVLQRAGLRDTLFIAMSNFYYEEKAAYLQALNDGGANGHDLTSFLTFGLRGIDRQCRRLFAEIRDRVAKALYRNTVNDLFGRLQSPRKRVMSGRHVQLLNLLLDEGGLSLGELGKRIRPVYTVKNPQKALVRDLNYLLRLEAIKFERIEREDSDRFILRVNLEWPTQITETEFFRRVKEMPKGKVYSFLSS
jgi:fido (protein-threonine AMPylation protein)